MASVLPHSGAGISVGEFAEVINGLGVGIVTLDAARKFLARALQTNAANAPALQALINEALHEGQLGPEEHDALTHDISRWDDEDPPTESAENTVTQWDTDEKTVPRAGAVSDPDAPGPETAPLYPGAVLRNRFVLQSRVKTSHMSEVFKAIDRRRQEAGDPAPWVAVKLVSPDAQPRSTALNALQQEAALAQRLNHPNIVRVLDFDRDNEHAFITMEWLEGESLADRLAGQRAQPLSAEEALCIVAAIGKALAFAHGQGIAHADVKPGNIFLVAGAEPRLLDFGVARVAGENDEASEAHTMAYASCEILEGAAPTAQDDVYALACVAYRMLTGRRVFGHQDALAAERSGRRPARIRTLAPAQWAALERALGLRRAARTKDMALFLAEFLSPPPRQAPPPVPASPLPKRQRVPATPAPTAVPSAGIPSAPAARPAVRRAVPPHQVEPEGTGRPRLGWALAASALLLAVGAWLWPSGESPPSITTSDTPAAAVSSGPPAAPPGASKPAAARPRAKDRTAVPAPDPAKAPSERRKAAAPAAVRRAERQPASTQAPAAQPREAATAAPSTTPEPAPAAAVTDSTSQPTTNESLAGSAQPQSMTLAASDRVELPTGAAPQAPLPASPTEAAAAAPGPREMLLTELTFKRYVEPRDKRSVRLQPEGWVQLSFTVDRKGRPRNISIVGADPPGRYEDIALAAVRRWRFEPVVENGEAVELRTGVRVRFQPE